VDETAKRENLIVIKSMTKFFGIPGLRLGYLVSNSEMVDKISYYKEPWSVNVFAQKAGVACFKDDRFSLKTKRFIDRERAYMLDKLGKLKGLKAYDSSTNYLLIKIVKSGLSSGKLYEMMARKGFLIRDCSSFKGMGNKFVRVAVKRRKQNNLLIDNLKRVMEG
jgi:threonine-phosphate decarboxylase